MDRRKVLVLGFLLGGCSSGVQHQTASGRPERTFAAPPDQVRAALVSHLVNRGYQIMKESQSLVTAEKMTDSVMANMLLGTNYDRQVKVRVQYTMIPQGTQTRVVGDLALVSNSGSSFERVTPVNNTQSSQEMQNALNSLQVTS